MTAREQGGGVDVAGLRVLAEAATPGPWEKGIEDAQADMPPDYAIWMPEVGHDGALVEVEADADYIAAANPAALLALLDRLEAAERKVAACEALRDEFDAISREPRRWMAYPAANRMLRAALTETTP